MAIVDNISEAYGKDDYENMKQNWDPNTYGLNKYPDPYKAQQQKTAIDLDAVMTQLKAAELQIRSASIEERLVSIEHSLKTILELLGVVLQIRADQLKDTIPKE